ncbi:MogA/MoaB family molybdenum cofactor biosynthesis protein [Leucobacter sp. W1153]|uniref:MogA/MoaB family molybdenum cofactor biosynthesis protein n=1 Tax=Leucobacter sp. W1153 TaxID=3439064 RepID=UPI003F3FA6F2
MTELHPELRNPKSPATPAKALVIVASTRAAAGEAEDTTGPEICRWLQGRGFAVSGPVVVADGEPVGEAARAALVPAEPVGSAGSVGSAAIAASPPTVILITGGTGVSASDRTPEMVGPLLDLQVPGLIEELRRRGTAKTPGAALTRGVAGFAGATFIMTLPGSPGGVRDGLEILEEVLDHLLAQRQGRSESHP